MRASARWAAANAARTNTEADPQPGSTSRRPHPRSRPARRWGPGTPPGSGRRRCCPPPPRATNRVVAGDSTSASSSLHGVGSLAEDESCGTSRWMASKKLGVDRAAAASTLTLDPGVPGPGRRSRTPRSPQVDRATPGRLPDPVIEHLADLAVDRREDVLTPTFDPGQWHRQIVRREPARIGTLERVRTQFTADGPTVEEERVKRDAGEPNPQSVQHPDEAHRLRFDARLLEDLLDGDLSGRIADVAPPGRVEPDTPSRPAG